HEQGHDLSVLPALQDRFQQSVLKVMDLALLLDQVSAQHQIAMRIEHQRGGTISSDRLPEPLPVIIECATSHKAVFKRMLVVDVQPVSHSPVQHQVVVERDDTSEPP